MSYRSIQHEVDELLDRAQHPNIAHKDDGDYKLLTQIRKLPISANESIEIIKDVLEAIVYVSSHLIIYKPCQVFKEHVVLKHGRWGLKNIICYRDPKQSKEFNPDRYYPIDYDEHPDEDSELAWSLGRMWFFLLTDSAIPPIKALDENEISRIIATSGIKDIRISNLLKEILIIDKSKRLDLVTLIKHGLFEYEQKSKIYLHSVMPNLSQVQQMGKMIITTNRFQSKITKSQTNPYNPYEQQLFKRDFKQAIAIADLFQKVKQFIFNNFEVNQSGNQIHFCCYLIDLASYIRLNNFKLKREENQYLIVLLYDKLDYTRYLEKVLDLEGKLQRKRKMKKFSEFKPKYSKLFEPPGSITKQQYDKYVYPRFTRYVMNFAKCYKQQRIQANQTDDCASYVSLVEMMLIRSANYVFGNCRKYVFEEFMDRDQMFGMENILKNIQVCKDIKKLERLEQKILKLYFTENNENKNQ